MKTYHGFVNVAAGGPRTVLVDGKRLNPRHDLRNHSPDGFQWGYGGSGPSQLALAILADCKGDAFASEHYQRFKFAMIATLDGEQPFTLTEQEIEDWCAAQEART